MLLYFKLISFFLKFIPLIHRISLLQVRSLPDKAELLKDDLNVDIGTCQS